MHQNFTFTEDVTSVPGFCILTAEEFLEQHKEILAEIEMESAH